MYASDAEELLRELGRASWLPPYNEEQVKNVIKEVDQLFDDMTRLIQEQPTNEDGQMTFRTVEDRQAFLVGVTVYNTCIERNKQCTLAYVHRRLERIKQLWWQVGSAMPDELRKLCGPVELEFFREYDTAVGEYMKAADLELTSHQQPPKDLMIEVLVKEDKGTIVAESGAALTLKKDQLLHVKQSDVEHLIRQGILEHRAV